MPYKQYIIILKWTSSAFVHTTLINKDSLHQQAQISKNVPDTDLVKGNPCIVRIQKWLLLFRTSSLCAKQEKRAFQTFNKFSRVFCPLSGPIGLIKADHYWLLLMDHYEFGAPHQWFIKCICYTANTTILFRVIHSKKRVAKVFQANTLGYES